MNFIDTMRQMFGFNPATGETLNGSNIPVPRMASGAQPAYVGLNAGGASPEAADPTTPSPTGQVLATLRTTPRRLTPPTDQPQASGSPIGGGFASDIAGGMGQVKDGMSRGAAFFAGFGGAVKSVQDRAAAAAKAQNDADKAKLDVYKAMFDIQDKINNRYQQAQQNAETKRWHDIMAPSYSTDKSKGGGEKWDDMSAIDQSNAGQRFMHMAGIPDMSKPDGQAAWDMLKPEERQKRIKILRRLSPSLAGKIFDEEGAPKAATPDAQAPGPAAAKTPSKAATPPDATADDNEEDTSTTPPSTSGQPTAADPRTPAAQPATPTATAPQTWRRYRATDGSVKLFNPATGETQAIDASQSVAPQTQPSYQDEYDQMGRAYGAGS